MPLREWSSLPQQRPSLPEIHLSLFITVLPSAPLRHHWRRQGSKRIRGKEGPMPMSFFLSFSLHFCSSVARIVPSTPRLVSLAHIL